MEAGETGRLNPNHGAEGENRNSGRKESVIPKLRMKKEIMPINTMRTNRNYSGAPGKHTMTNKGDEVRKKKEKQFAKSPTDVIKNIKEEESEGEDSQEIYTRNHPGLRKAILIALIKGMWKNQEAETKQCLMKIPSETGKVCNSEIDHEDARLAMDFIHSYI